MRTATVDTPLRRPPPLRWKPEDVHAWHWAEGVWQHIAKDDNHFDWLRYTHTDQQPITDDVAYNAGVSRRLNLVQDFMLTADIRASGEGTLVLELDDGHELLRLTICPSTGATSLSKDGKTLVSKTLLDNQLGQEPTPLVLSNFDRQLLVVIDGQVVLRYPLTAESSPGGTSTPFAIGVQNLDLSLQNLTLYRDIYYSKAPTGALPTEANTPIRLGKDEYFVLGDNSPISVDSRVWGPISERLLLGRPIGGR